MSKSSNVKKSNNISKRSGNIKTFPDPAEELLEFVPKQIKLDQKNSVRSTSRKKKGHAEICFGLLFPSYTKYPPSWSKKKIREENQKRMEYLEEGLIPFFNRTDTERNCIIAGTVI